MDCSNLVTVRTMAGHIPNDLLIDILARLPVASLLRFRSVCKSWCSLITSPSFVTEHLNQSITNSKRNGDKVLVTSTTYKNRWKEERYLLLRDDENFGYTYTELESPFKRCFRIVGCCNGLVCLSPVFDIGNPYPLQVIIWNPSIRKSVTLPSSRDSQRQRSVAYGFGVHPATLKYKVVRIDYEMVVNKGSNEIPPPKAEIFEQGTSSWRAVTYAAPPYYEVLDGDSISHPFLNGAVHWIAYYRHEGYVFQNLIFTFNMASESFSEIMLPPTLVDQYVETLSIKLFRESLVVLCTSEQRDGGASSIWVLKEYGVVESWIKIFSSNLLGQPSSWPIGIRKNGEVLLESTNSLASYASRTKTLRDTGIRGSLWGSYVDTFIETLVLAEERDAVSQGHLTFREILLLTFEE